MPSSRHEVVVVGGGFGGLYAARTAARHGLDVVLVDAEGRQTFQPLLYQVATGLLPPDVAEFPLADLSRVAVVPARAEAVDLVAGTVTTADGRVLAGRRVVLATGAAVDFLGVPGAAEHALPLYTDTDARMLKARLRDLVETRRPFDVVVVGAGATGVEVTGAIADVVRDVLPRTFPDFDGASVTIHVVDRATQPLAHMSPATQAYARDVLQQVGVDFHLGTGVASVTADGVVLEDGTAITAGAVVWAGGLSARLPTLTPEPATGRGGRVLVDPMLRLPGHPDAFAVGDCAADAKSPLPQLAAVARQQGLHVGRSLHRMARGHHPEPFAFRDLGIMAMLRRDRAVVEAGTRRTEVEGLAAYGMWLGLHAALLPDAGDRAEAIRDWMQEWATGRSRFLAD